MEESVGLKKYILIYSATFLIASLITLAINAIYHYDIGYFEYITNFISANLSALAFVYYNHRIPNKLEAKKLIIQTFFATLAIDIICLVIQMSIINIPYSAIERLDSILATTSLLSILLALLILCLILFFIVILPTYLIVFLTYKYISNVYLEFFNKYFLKQNDIQLNKINIESENVANNFSLEKYIVLFVTIYAIFMFTNIALIEFNIIAKSITGTAIPFISAMLVSYKFVYDNNRIPSESEKLKLIWLSLLTTFVVDVFRYIVVMSLSDKTNLLLKLKSNGLMMSIPVVLFLYFAQLAMFYIAYGYMARKTVNGLLKINKKQDKFD